MSDVHAWSLTIAVMSVLLIIATIVVVVLLPLMLAPPFDDASLSQQSCEVLFDTPSWCGGFTTTPPTEDDVHDEAVVLVGCVSVAVEALFLVDTVVRCLCCVTVGVEPLKDDEVEVADTDLVADVAEVIVDLSCRSCCISVDDQC